uniref:Uncharacterized protein n=1 Tax=Daphnia galeata TaxID=27404 RepID=A0A8J2RLN7_9CRUS|nr:unnamed protein product [Daphnia galeata]
MIHFNSHVADSLIFACVDLSWMLIQEFLQGFWMALRLETDMHDSEIWSIQVLLGTPLNSSILVHVRLFQSCDYFSKQQSGWPCQFLLMVSYRLTNGKSKLEAAPLLVLIMHESVKDSILKDFLTSVTMIHKLVEFQFQSILLRVVLVVDGDILR